jgi:hypothetical protein
MSAVPRVIAAFLFSLPFVVVASGAPDSTVGVSKEVIALREAVPAMSDGKSVNAAVDFLAPLQMRVIGGNDSTWKRNNPNWMPVLTLIRKDLKKDLQPVLVAQASDGVARWNRELSAHLTPAQIDELLAFYRSATGRRYVTFQKHLIAIQEDGSSEIMTTFASGGRDPHRVAESEPSPAQLDAREKLIALSWVNQFEPMLGTSVSPSDGVNPGADKEISDMMVNIVAKRCGRELDALLVQYQRDLPAFSTFQESPVAKALLNVYGDVAKDAGTEPAKPGSDVKAALDQSIAKHTAAWKAAYEAGRTGGH